MMLGRVIAACEKRRAGLRVADPVASRQSSEKVCEQWYGALLAKDASKTHADNCRRWVMRAAQDQRWQSPREMTAPEMRDHLDGLAISAKTRKNIRSALDGF